MLPRVEAGQRALGEGEMDFRFSLLQPRCGFRHFSLGVSNLKQVTGHEHRNIQCYIIGVIAGAAPAEFILAIRALLDLCYFAQMRCIDTTVLAKISTALRTFHHHKQIILNNQYQVSKSNIALTHFKIPKLELLHSVVPCIQWFGALPQWSADRTEYSHIDFVKRPKSKTNGHDYSSQICRHLDRAEKIHSFDLATTIWETSAEDPDISNHPCHEDDPTPHNIEDHRPLRLQTPVPLKSKTRPTPDFFNATLPPSRSRSACDRTFAVRNTAFHFNIEPDITRTSVDEAAAEFRIPDLCQNPF